jgi:hypothetical protein
VSTTTLAASAIEPGAVNLMRFPLGESARREDEGLVTFQRREA